MGKEESGYVLEKEVKLFPGYFAKGIFTRSESVGLCLAGL